MAPCPAPPAIDLFVYGTLKPGEINHHVCADYVRMAQPAIAQGSLYHLPLGYPAMSLAPADLVYGYVLRCLDPGVMALLDRFEQHDPHLFRQLFPQHKVESHQYQRLPIQTYTHHRRPLTIAWSYTMTLRQIQRLQGRRVASGEWNQPAPNQRLKCL